MLNCNLFMPVRIFKYSLLNIENQNINLLNWMFFKLKRNLSNINAYNTSIFFTRSNKIFLDKYTIKNSVFYCSKNICNEINSILNTTKNKYKQLGYVNITDISKTIKELEKINFNFTYQDIVSLFEMAFHAIYRDYRPCNILVNKFWHFFFCNKNASLSQKELLLYLKMCIHSNNKIDLSEFLKIVEENDNFSLSQEICELLLSNLAHYGDNEGSKVILGIMKENEMALNMNVFKALILLNGLNRDSKGIRDVLNTMEIAKVKPTIAFKSQLLISHIYCKDFDVVRKIMDRIKSSNEKLNNDEFSAIVYHFVKSDNFRLYTTIFDHILESRVSIANEVDLKKTILKLIHENYPKEAIYILCQLSDLKKNSKFYNNNAVFIRELVRAKCDSTVIVDLCQSIKDAGYNDFAFEVALEASLMDFQMELSWTLLRTLKAKEEPLKEHYFWPLLAMQFPNDDHAVKAIRCLQGMTELDVTAGNETLRDYVIPKLPLENSEITFKMLSRAGISETRAVTPLLSVLLRKGLMDEAKKLVQNTKLVISTEYILKDLCHNYSNSPKETLEILNLLVAKQNEKKKENKKDFGGLWIKDLFTFTDIGLDILKITQVCQFMKDANLRISRETCEEILNLVASTLHVDVSKNFEPLVQEDLHPTRSQKYFIPPPEEMTIDELEAHLLELKAKQMNTRGILRKLLIRHSSMKNISRFKQIVQEISEGDLKISPGMRSSQMQTMILDKDLEGALECYYILTLENPDFFIDSYKVVDICRLLVNEKRTREAFQIVTEYTNKTQKSLHNKKGITRNCHALLTAIADQEEPETTKVFTNLLINGGLADPSPVILGTVIKAVFKSNDLNKVVSEAENIYTKYGVLPMRVDILVRLIQNLNYAKEKNKSSHSSTSEDVRLDPKIYMNLIDKMIGLCTSARGFKQAREDLLVASLETGNITECLRIFKFVEKDLLKERIRALCNNYVRKENTEALLTLLKISKESRKVDRMYICHSLLNIYSVQRGGVDALNLWALMQEENVTPSDFFMEKLSKLLKATNIPLKSNGTAPYE